MRTLDEGFLLASHGVDGSYSHPRSANVWDSLGDGYRAKGQVEQAIAAYPKALEIDPNFAVSSRNLEELQREQG